MKTLDEVITALDVCTNGKGCENCPYAVYDEDGFEEYTECEKLKTDALRYLLEYRQDCEDLVEAAKSLTKKEHEFAIEDKNEPLTWDELKQMEGKPVWVEENWHKYEAKYWSIHHGISDGYDGDEILYLQPFTTLSKNNMGKTWQAYRKERE